MAEILWVVSPAVKQIEILRILNDPDDMKIKISGQWSILEWLHLIKKIFWNSKKSYYSRNVPIKFRAHIFGPPAIVILNVTDTLFSLLGWNLEDN